MTVSLSAAPSGCAITRQIVSLALPGPNPEMSVIGLLGKLSARDAGLCSKAAVATTTRSSFCMPFLPGYCVPRAMLSATGFHFACSAATKATGSAGDIARV